MNGRGQTTIDFAIGTSVFLVTVAFVVAFVPGIFQPFAEGPQEELASVDRIADTVVHDLLDGGDDTTTLDRECTIYLFNDTDTDPTGTCPFDDSDPLSEQVGLSEGHHVNVTVVGGDPNGGSQNPVCTDGQHVTVSDTDDCTGGVALNAGEPVPSSGASVIGRRVVHVDGTTATVVVRMW
ncbi:hypothetical protein EI982_06850 [Haloplanus rallus]|uniref:Uncharacterized protein n=1 Tax=Haloplanus rallus TaxID=1816183 RepID=A0A6B9F828_9EURY|nr:hypothetical protein [Haloplanus rallus]QGX94524.1 hypothetical protein EI982_06850 [Haloplanus rallus]